MEARTAKRNWMDVVKRDLKDMDITMEEAEVLAADRKEWRQLVAD